MSTTRRRHSKIRRISLPRVRQGALLTRLFCCSFALFGSLALADQRIITSPSSVGEVSVNIGQRVVRAMYQRCGYGVHFLEVPAARAFVMAEAGQSEGELARVKAAVKPGAPLLSLNEVLLELPLVPVYFGGGQLAPSGSKGERWGFLQGYRQFARKMPAEVTAIPVRGTEQMHTMLERRRIDVALMMEFDARVYSRLDSTLVVGKPAALLTLYHFVHESKVASISCLSRQLAAMKQDGEYDRVISDTVEEYVAAKQNAVTTDDQSVNDEE
ncbi:hypothetical protein ACTXGQ_04665 [Marinobacter sp. 1Y8]